MSGTCAVGSVRYVAPTAAIVQRRVFAARISVLAAVRKVRTLTKSGVQIWLTDQSRDTLFSHTTCRYLVAQIVKRYTWTSDASKQVARRPETLQPDIRDFARTGTVSARSRWSQADLFATSYHSIRSVYPTDAANGAVECIADS